MAICFLCTHLSDMQKNGSKIPKGSCEDDPDRSERCYLSMILNDRDMVGLNSPDVGRCFFFVFVFFSNLFNGDAFGACIGPILKDQKRYCPMQEQGVSWFGMGTFGFLQHFLGKDWMDRLVYVLVCHELRFTQTSKMQQTTTKTTTGNLRLAMFFVDLFCYCSLHACSYLEDSHPNLCSAGGDVAAPSNKGTTGLDEGKGS